jgi:hypothetical protein
MTEPPFVEILLTKLDAKLLYDVLPSGGERQNLRKKIQACNTALAFLRGTLDDTGQFCFGVEMPRASKHSSRYIV